MAKFTDTFEDVMEQIPPGEYNLRLIGWEAKTSQKGGQYFNWKGEIYGSSDARCNGKNLYFITMRPPSGGSFKLFQLLSILIPGFKSGDAYDPDNLMGLDLSVITQESRDESGKLRSFPNVISFGKVKTSDNSDDISF